MDHTDPQPALLIRSGQEAAASRPTGTGTGVEARERFAAALYPTKPARVPDQAPNAAVAAVRAAEPARELYVDEKQFGPNGGAPREFALALSPAASREQLGQQTTQWASIAADLGLDQADLRNWAQFASAAATKPPTEAERLAWQRTAVRELRATYGEGFDEALQDAMALTRRDPRVAAMFSRTHLGDHPAVVLRMAELGRQARLRGQLK